MERALETMEPVRRELMRVVYSPEQVRPEHAELVERERDLGWMPQSQSA
jgi:hypothetical protein